MLAAVASGRTDQGWRVLLKVVAGARNGQYLEFPWTIAEIAPDKPTATTRV